MSTRQKYDFARLDQYCKENNVVLLEDYSNRFLTRSSIINGKCAYNNCDESFEKNLHQIINTCAYCVNCIKNITTDEIEKPVYIIKYGFENLQNYCNKNNITLLEDYSSIQLKQKSRIFGTCLTSNCPNSFNKSFENLFKRDGYCNSCTKNNKIKKQKQTFIKNYGVENPNKIKDIREKIKITNLEKYGMEHSFQSEMIKNKIKQSCLEKYGVENPLQNKDIMKKLKNTCLEKYGTECASNNKIIRTKIKQTILEKYGVEYASQNKNIREKIKNTNLKNWGVENPSQNAEISEKASNNSYKSKSYTFPSGKIIKCQGYEPFAFRDLVNLKINETDIINKRTDVPEIWFTDDNNKKHRYYVDIYVPSQNKCIEVKSYYTYKNNEKVNLLKKLAVKNAGYNFEFWLYDCKGNRVVNFDNEIVT